MNLRDETDILLMEHPLKLATRGYRYLSRRDLRKIARSLSVSTDTLQSLYLKSLDEGVRLPPLLLNGSIEARRRN